MRGIRKPDGIEEETAPVREDAPGTDAAAETGQPEETASDPPVNPPAEQETEPSADPPAEQEKEPSTDSPSEQEAEPDAVKQSTDSAAFRQTGDAADAYSSLAPGYDDLMGEAHYQRRAEFLYRLLQKSAIPVKTVLDLGCGTGTIAWMLAEKGFRVIAIDASEEMLTAAMRKAVNFPPFAPPLFVRQSMQKLHIGTPADAAISTLDALNYLLTGKDLQETLRRVHRDLRPGGQFIFDVNTPYKLRRMDHQIYMDEVRGSFCVWRTFFTEKNQICTYQVDLFRQRSDGAWDRRMEEHRQRAWSEAELRAFLEAAGFVRIRVTGDLTRRGPKMDADRWTVLAERDG